MTHKKRRNGNPGIKDLGIATRFQPGVSGNPGGRPKMRILSDMLAAIGCEVEPKSGKTWFQLAAEALVSKAFRGDVQAFREIADRVDGRSIQSVELSGPDGLSIAHSIADLDQRILELLERGQARARDAVARGEGRIVPGESDQLPA
jgi:hypothetical protein